MPITVFEDDIATHPQFQKRAAEVLAALPQDWDFVQWGCTLNNKWNLSAWIDLGRLQVRIDGVTPPRWKDEAGYRAFQAEPLTAAAPIKLIHSYGTFAYSISSKGARLALAHCLPLRKRMIAVQNTWWMHDNGLDVTMCGFYPQHQAYLSFPQIVIPCLVDSERKATDAANKPKPA